MRSKGKMRTRQVILATQQRLMKAVPVGMLLMVVLTVSSCRPLEARPGPEFDGSAQWAFDLAQPHIANFASDAHLYVIAGARVQTDGRLPANVGSWSFIVWSSSLQQKMQVTVNHAGTVETETEDRGEPPGRGQPMPVNWLNSPAIFQAAWPHVNDAPKEVLIVLVNWSDYPEAPGQAVWALSYSNPGGNHRVRWDGVYLAWP